VRRVLHFKQDRNAGLCRFSTPELKYNATLYDLWTSPYPI